MSKRLHIHDHKNAQAFVVNMGEGSALPVADFYYDYGVPKRVVRKAASAFLKTITKHLKK
jgi:hypothetical protein